MPLYRYQCKECNHEFEEYRPIDRRYDVLCPECGEGKIEIIIKKPASYHPFPEGWWEHLDVKPIYISSRRQLKDECKKRGLRAKYLE